jgi:hypothetical protein
VGPTCLANLVGRAEVRRSRKTVVVAVDQPDLFGDEHADTNSAYRQAPAAQAGGDIDGNHSLRADCKPA